MSEKASRPAFCPFIYRNEVDIFLEFDNMVLRFPKTEGGMAKALKHVPSIEPLVLKPHTCAENGTAAKRVAAKSPKKKVSRKPGVALSDDESRVLSGLLEGLKEGKGK